MVSLSLSSKYRLSMNPFLHQTVPSESLHPATSHPKYSFYPRAIKEWNNLPINVIESLLNFNACNY